MKLSIDHNIPAVKAALDRALKQVPFAMSVALNATAEEAKGMVQESMRTVFDRPTPWVINSLRVKRSSKTNLVAELAFKDFRGDSTKTMLAAQVDGGARRFKAVEVKLRTAGFLPTGYNVVPGKAASLDEHGNMVRSQVAQILSMLAVDGAMPSSVYKNRARVAKGNVKRNQHGFEYFVAPVGGRNSRLQPGVYKRFSTGFGTSLKPILIFAKPARYTKRLEFFGLVEKKAKERLEPNFKVAFDQAVATAFKNNGG